MKLFACVAALVGLAAAADPLPSWAQWKAEFNKVYAPAEEARRLAIWQDNLEYVQAHNAKGLSYELGMTIFADMTQAEYLELVSTRPAPPKAGSTYLRPQNVVLPDAVDWRTKGVVTDVKDQKACGSCWAFSATGSLEPQHALKAGSLVSLSEQQLVDCSRDYGNYGCGGGLMTNAFDYIIAVHGIEGEDDYPYTAHDDKCVFDVSKVKATVTGYTNIKRGDEEDLQSAIATVGPVSVAIDAGHASFQLYKKGVYDEPACSPTNLDHGVTAVGYDTDDSGKQYYIVKNSWGKGWGDQGYILMSRNKSNQCGIATMSTYPLV